MTDFKECSMSGLIPVIMVSGVDLEDGQGLKKLTKNPDGYIPDHRYNQTGIRT